MPDGWRIEMPMGGRDGYFGYYEGSRAASFYWEFGSGDVVAIIYIGKASEWSEQYPWAVDRRQEIMERVSQEVIRQRAPTCRADIDVRDDGFTYLLIREAASPCAMTDVTKRSILRWIHIIFALPIFGYIYGPPSETLQYLPYFRFGYFPVVVLSGFWMWKGQVVRRLILRIGKR